jgi:hypothetical protein
MRNSVRTDPYFTDRADLAQKRIHMDGIRRWRARAA